MLRRHQQLRPPKADLRIRRGVDSKGDTPQDDKDGNHLSHQRNAYTVQALNEDLFRYSKYRAYRAIQWKAQRAVYEFYRLLLDVRKIRLESGVPRSVAKPLPEVRPRLGLGFPEKLLSIMMSARAFKASPYIPRRDEFPNGIRLPPEEKLTRKPLLGVSRSRVSRPLRGGFSLRMVETEFQPPVVQRTPGLAGLGETTSDNVGSTHFVSEPNNSFPPNSSPSEGRSPFGESFS